MKTSNSSLGSVLQLGKGRVLARLSAISPDGREARAGGHVARYAISTNKSATAATTRQLAAQRLPLNLSPTGAQDKVFSAKLKEHVMLSSTTCYH
jgi:hypothetical protein